MLQLMEIRRRIPASCSSARTLLSAWVAGDASPAETDQVARHLAICVPCRREEASLRAAMDVLRTAPVVQLPDSALEDLRRRIDAPRQLRIRPLSVAAGLALAGATALALPRFVPQFHSVSSVPAPVSQSLSVPAPVAIAPTDPNGHGKGAPQIAGAPLRNMNNSAEVPVVVISPARIVRSPVAARYKAPRSFLEVVPTVGHSARQQIAAGKKANARRDLAALHLGAHPKMAVVSEQDDVLKVAGRTTHITAGYVASNASPQSIVSVNISSAPAPSTSVGQDSTQPLSGGEAQQ